MLKFAYGKTLLIPVFIWHFVEVSRFFTRSKANLKIIVKKYDAPYLFSPSCSCCVCQSIIIHFLAQIKSKL